MTVPCILQMANSSLVAGGQGRGRTGDLPLFRRTLVPTELPGRKALLPPSASPQKMATLTGLEPATSAVTGRRANQLRHGAMHRNGCLALRTPNGIRTRATALKGRRPRPLDDGGLAMNRRAEEGALSIRDAANPSEGWGRIADPQALWVGSD